MELEAGRKLKDSRTKRPSRPARSLRQGYVDRGRPVEGEGEAVRRDGCGSAWDKGR